MAGRLTLSWANKDRALLSHGEDGYEWVDRDDPRAREVRLLDEIPDATGRVGEVSGGVDDNLLIRGDSLDALRALVKSPEYAAEYRGKVKLVYIDPPFNTGQAFEHYDDSLEHSVWLGMMRERLVLIRDLLAPDGSVWVHLDDAEMAYCKVLMDEVFGRQNFIATVVWQKRRNLPNDRPMASNHDSIVVFGSERPFNLRPRPEDHGGYTNLDDDPRGAWTTHPVDANAKGGRHVDHLFYAVTNPTTGVEHWPARGRNWLYAPEEMASRIERGAVIFGRTGRTGPVKKAYLSETRDGLTWPSLWLDDALDAFVVNNDADRELKALFPDTPSPFSTPKPERLLERVIHIASNRGDIVLDAFAGSGTTAAVAHKMGRRWVTVELSENTADTFTAPRLTKVVNGEDPGGITASAGWAGGGGFRQLRVAPSTWQMEDGEAYLLDGVDEATLGRAVATQLGYAPVEHPVFVGTKGRSRLAVLHGVADAVAVDDIASSLGEGETALVAALAIADGAATRLSDLRPGSRLIRITTDLFPARTTVTR